MASVNDFLPPPKIKPTPKSKTGICAVCNGTGENPDPDKEYWCDSCDGSGRNITHPDGSTSLIEPVEELDFESRKGWGI